ncbi:MFS transporter [Xenorhabdus khoisanae]|uniref:MFS transporter n=1 Tax=Xenorhabdus khoisanae TaxID=880157 RepID=A0A0J5IRB8_9GAMM|nr:MFS transporter [Xenorhabdus khoisanae]KMJ45755.1 MFS transporter [Xenorhabdus khoisanae]
MMNSHINSSVVLSQKLLFLLALGAGLGVANVYYLQPALYLVQSEFDVGAERIGLVPTLTQIGYAVGMLFLAPLGDILSRRNMIFAKSLFLALALTLAALAPNLSSLAIAGVAIGLLSSVGQDFIPVAAQLSPESRRGYIVGTVTTGLLIGILLSRTLGGLISDLLGWRGMQLIAAGLMLTVALLVRSRLPALPPVLNNTKYNKLLRSLWDLWRQHRSLKISVITQALLASTLGAFWSTLAIVLSSSPYNQGASVAGAFGIAGAAGALGASLFGRLADKKGPLLAIRLGCGLVFISFVGMWLLPSSLITLAIGAMTFDLGVMAALVSHQFIVNSVDSNARSRLNGLLMTGAMCGMAVGAAVGSFVWANFGWGGLCVFCLLASLLGLALSSFHNNNGVFKHG